MDAEQKREKWPSADIPGAPSSREVAQERPMSTQEKQALWFSRATRFGVSVAIITALSIGAREIMKVFPVPEPYFTWGLVAVMAGGVVSLVIDLERYKRKSTAEEILRFFHNPHYWGWILLVTGGIVYVISNPAPPLIVRARTIPRPPPVTNAPPVFPDLQVTSVVINGEKSAARINDSVVWLNEDIQGVKLVSVSETNIVVELAGFRKDIPWSP